MSIKIGLETHIQLATESKLFCGCPTDAVEMPNQNTCPICLGFPGSKPVLNQKATQLAILLGMVCKCNINQNSRFARKTYFYPDLPKGYQITQYEEPLATNGEIEIETTTGKKKIRIRRIHIEEDPGRIVYAGGAHIGTAKYVLLDYSRAGMPLCEIVTEPDFSSEEEANTYSKKLFQALEHYEIINPHSAGVMRTDANISIDGGERVELKNITGFIALEKALKAEIHRQQYYKTSGKIVERETRVYSDETETTIRIRRKEIEEDYGYIYEPDLLRLTISEEQIEAIKQNMKRSLEEIQQSLSSTYQLSMPYASVLVSRKDLPDYFESCVKLYPQPERLAKWICGDFLKCLNWNELDVKNAPSPEIFVRLLKKIDEKQVTERGAKELIKKMFSERIDLDILLENSKEIDYEKIIAIVLAENLKAVEDFRGGKTKSLEFLIGQLLRKCGPKADPKIIRTKLVEKIKK